MSRHRGPRGQEAQGVLGAAMHEVVGMNVVPARDLGNDRLGRQELPIRSFSANVHRRRAPDRKAPSPLSRLPINLQINEQTSHRESNHRLITGAPIIERLRCGHIDYGSSSSCDYGGVGGIVPAAVGLGKEALPTLSR